MINRRRLLAGASLAAVGTLAAPSILRAQSGQTVKMGALRLVHSMPPHFYEKFAPPGLKIEIITFDSPTDCKNAVVTKSVDLGKLEAKVIALRLGNPPKGYSNWSLRLLAEHVVELGLVDSISHETIRQTLKKTE